LKAVRHVSASIRGKQVRISLGQPTRGPVREPGASLYTRTRFSLHLSHGSVATPLPCTTHHTSTNPSTRSSESGNESSPKHSSTAFSAAVHSHTVSTSISAASCRSAARAAARSSASSASSSLQEGNCKHAHHRDRSLNHLECESSCRQVEEEEEEEGGGG
jgi:hypothetical protein